MSALAAGEKQRICFVVSSPMTAVAFLTDHIRALSERYEVTLVVNSDPSSIVHPDLRRATLHRARIERSISPLADLHGVLQLVAIFRRGRYSSVHSLTPKAGLLAAIAAFIARTPVRIHTYTGQVWATRQGAGRWLLKQLDRLIAKLNTHLLADSASQLDFLRDEHVLTRAQGKLIGKGSVCGVDAKRFKPDARARASVRGELGIPPSALVFVFVGRLKHDKGVLELASAFEEIARARDDLFLLFVGPDEEGLAPQIRTRCAEAGPHLRLIGWTDRPERYIAASDIFCLPSHREGFGSVIIEAAAAGLPAIGSRINGIVDAIEDGIGGLLYPARDEPALARAMQNLANEEGRRKALGAAARARALRDFAKESLTSELLVFYERILQSTKRETQQERLRSRFD